MVRRRFIALSIAALLACSATPGHAQIKTFRDWIAACDNLRNCSAHGYRGENRVANLRIERDGTPSARATVTLAVNPAPFGDPSYRTFKVEFDVPAPVFLTGPIATDKPDKDALVRIESTASGATIAAALRKAKFLIITQVDPPPDPPDDTVAKISLDGARAALAWIDRQQRRAGTVTALIRRGPEPERAVPAAPRIPTIATAIPSSEPAPQEPPPEILARGNATCGPKQEAAEHVRTHRLTAAMLMVWFSCPYYSGASSLNHAVLLLPDGNPKAARKPRFLLPPEVAVLLPRNELTGRKDGIFDPSFDPDTGTLTSLHARRGAGDCGEMIDWVFNGRDFRMIELRMMKDCEGVPPRDWPVLYRAAIRGR